MKPGRFSKLEERWRAERAERVRRSAELRRLLVEHGSPLLRSYGVREAWLFGSVAAGRAEQGSDLDLLAMPVATADYWPLRRDLEATLGCPLDLYTQDDDAVLVRKVVERGDLVYEIQP